MTRLTFVRGLFAMLVALALAPPAAPRDRLLPQGTVAPEGSAEPPDEHLDRRGFGGGERMPESKHEHAPRTRGRRKLAIQTMVPGGRAHFAATRARRTHPVGSPFGRSSRRHAHCVLENKLQHKVTLKSSCKFDVQPSSAQAAAPLFIVGTSIPAPPRPAELHTRPAFSRVVGNTSARHVRAQSSTPPPHSVRYARAQLLALAPQSAAACNPKRACTRAFAPGPPPHVLQRNSTHWDPRCNGRPGRAGKADTVGTERVAHPSGLADGARTRNQSDRPPGGFHSRQEPPARRPHVPSRIQSPQTRETIEAFVAIQARRSWLLSPTACRHEEVSSRFRSRACRNRAP